MATIFTRNRISWRSALVAAATLCPLAASAATVSIGLDQPFFANPCQSTAECAPYASATISDVGDAGSNLVRIELSYSEKVPKNWYLFEFLLNFGPNGADELDPTRLKIEQVGGNQKVAEKNGIDTGANRFMGRGGGYFDIRFEFPSSVNADRFTPGDTAIFDVTSDDLKFSALSFFNLSCRKGEDARCSPSGGDPVFAAGTQLIDASLGRVTWIYATQPIPVPAAVWLLAAGLAGLAGVARRTARQA
jgi:hypothetical protein